MIIAEGLNKRPNPPKGPERDNNRKNVNPTTTGGRPISALIATIATDRPGKRDTASKAPKGRPISAARHTAVKVTRRDRATIPKNTGSRRMISARASIKGEALSIIGPS